MPFVQSGDSENGTNCAPTRLQVCTCFKHHYIPKAVFIARRFFVTISIKSRWPSAVFNSDKTSPLSSPTVNDESPPPALAKPAPTMPPSTKRRGCDRGRFTPLLSWVSISKTPG